MTTEEFNKRIFEMDKAAKEYAADNLLELKNSTHWLADDEKPITKEEFIDRIKLYSLMWLGEDIIMGYVEKDDRDLLFRHFIDVTIEDYKPVCADMRIDMNYENDDIDKKCREFAAEKLLSKRDFIRSHRIFSMEENMTELPECDNTPITKEQFMEYMSIESICKLLDRFKVIDAVKVPINATRIVYKTDEKLFYKGVFIFITLENNEPVDADVVKLITDNGQSSYISVPTEENFYRFRVPTNDNNLEEV